MNLPPLITTLSNAALEAKLRFVIQQDPFWREQLTALNGLRCKIILTDIGFKRVIQFGPSNLHLLAPFTDAEVSLTTRCIHLSKLADAQETQQAIEEGLFFIQGDVAAFNRLTTYYRNLDIDWQHQLAQFLPNPLPYQITSTAILTKSAVTNALNKLQQSYQFWVQNEHHGQ